MQDVKKLIDRLEPAPTDRGDWGAVLRDAEPPPRRRLARAFVPVLAAAAALFALALFQPWERERPTFLERALAAVEDGPVLHVVLRGEWGGTLVDLESGTRRPIYGENEIWYDFERGLMHSATKLGGVVELEEVSEPREPAADIAALGREYRKALEGGTARIVDEDTVGGEPVAWIVIRSENLPDSADGKLHAWAEEVAVSRETYEPVALRQTRDGQPGPGTLQRVQKLELLPSGHGDFSASKDLDPTGMVFMDGRDPISLQEAEDALGRTPLWLGREHHGLELAATFRTTAKTGRQERIELTGADAREAKRCFDLAPKAARPCFRALGIHPLENRPDGVFTRGETVWESEQHGLQLFYGTAGDDPQTYRTEDDVPMVDRPHLTITETVRPGPFFRMGGGSYVPPEGSVLIHAGGRTGRTSVDGIRVWIEASSEDLVLAAARALEPMPR